MNVKKYILEHLPHFPAMMHQSSNIKHTHIIIIIIIIIIKYVSETIYKVLLVT